MNFANHRQRGRTWLRALSRTLNSCAQPSFMPSSPREEFEEAGKILDDYSNRSAIAGIVKDNPPRKEMQRVKQQVRQCLKEVINNLDYQPTKSEQTHWHTRNPGAFNHFKNMGDVNKAIRQHLLAINTHKQKLKIISGLSISDVHTFRCQMQETHVTQSSR